MYNYTLKGIVDIPFGSVIQRAWPPFIQPCGHFFGSCVKFINAAVPAKFSNQDGTVGVPWWYSNCTITENTFGCGRGFGGIWVFFLAGV